MIYSVKCCYSIPFRFVPFRKLPKAVPNSLISHFSERGKDYRGKVTPDNLLYSCFSFGYFFGGGGGGGGGEEGGGVGGGTTQNHSLTVTS